MELTLDRLDVDIVYNLRLLVLNEKKNEHA